MSQLHAKTLQQQAESPIAHFLIGVPGSGKSTFAQLISQLENCEIVSTDNIRAELYGNASIQGDWQQIEAQAIERIYNALKTGKRIIYDATNFKRANRLDFLQKVKRKFLLNCFNTDEFNSYAPIWVGWYLNTPIETSITWNQMRSRQVPKAVIQSMYEALQNFPPITAEGFALINTIDVTSHQLSLSDIKKRINKIPRSIINSQNRNANITPHQYSNFLDFERLLHLISLIIRYPGIGNLQNSHPSLLETILGQPSNFTSDIQEVTAILAKEHGNVYACEQAIIDDLQYLSKVGILAKSETSSNLTPQPIDLQPDNGEASKALSWQQISLHSYSDKTIFNRLIGTIRLIVHHPFLTKTYESNQLTFTKALEEAGVIYNAKSELDKIRKDIEKILKPYKILPSFPMRNGYFAGTGILSQQELIKVFEILQTQAKNLDDPLTIDFYHTFKQRLTNSKLINSDEKIYPIRAITNHSIVDEEYLHETSLLKKISCLEDAIINGKLLELNRFRSSAKHKGDANSFIQVYPLQIVFHNLAWYLGYECVYGEEEPGLLRFERLDRLFLGNPQNQFRSRQEQEKALLKLHKLVKASAGIFLGNSAADQRKFFSLDQNTRSQVLVTIELWFNDPTYRFIIEGTKRFSQIKMSRPRFPGQVNLPQSIFRWDEPTGDKDFPNRFQAVLTKWSLDDFDLWRWIIGFSGSVKVIEPVELLEKIKKIAREIIDVYE